MDGFQLFTGKAGDNQFGNWGTPAVTPGFTGTVPALPASPGYGAAGPGLGVSGLNKQGGSGYSTVNTLFPQFTEEFYNYLSDQIGKGVTPFNLSAYLPSTGAASTPGQLSAPLTPVLQQLENFYGGGPSSVPGAASLASMANTGNPTDVGSLWDKMVAAQQRNISQNAANLREQFGTQGVL